MYMYTCILFCNTILLMQCGGIFYLQSQYLFFNALVKKKKKKKKKIEAWFFIWLQETFGCKSEVKFLFWKLVWYGS